MTHREDNKLSEMLIGKVCSYQCLYNPGNISYKSKRTKNMCWLKIGLECNIDASVAKGKWKSLRDRYVRERKAEKIAEHCGTVAPRKEWSLYKYLSFLDPFLATLEIRTTIAQQNESRSVKNECDESPSDDSSPVTECHEFSGHFLDMHSYSKPMQDPSVLVVPPPQPAPQQPARPSQPYVYILPAPAATDPIHSEPASKKAKLSVSEQSTNNTPVSNLERRFMKYVNQHGHEFAEEYSSDEMFVLSLVPSFNKLTEARKDKLKLDMHKLVYDAVYGCSN